MATIKAEYYRLNGSAWDKYYFKTTADMVEGLGSLSSLKITDVRNYNPAGAPEYLRPPNGTEQALNLDFAYVPGLASWKSIMTMRGWVGEGYAAWQLIGNANQPGDDGEKLHYRYGVNTTWNPVKAIASEDWSLANLVGLTGNQTIEGLKNFTSYLNSGVGYLISHNGESQGSITSGGNRKLRITDSVKDGEIAVMSDIPTWNTIASKPSGILREVSFSSGTGTMIVETI